MYRGFFPRDTDTETETETVEGRESIGCWWRSRWRPTAEASGVAPPIRDCISAPVAQENSPC